MTKRNGGRRPTSTSSAADVAEAVAAEATGGDERRRLAAAVRVVPLLPSQRLLIYALGALMIFVLTLNYATLNFAWVCMVGGSGNETSPLVSHYKVDWDRSVQQNLFAAWGMGQLSALVLPGLLMDRYGCKYVAVGGLFLAGAGTGAISFVYHWGWGWVMAARFFVGVGNSVGWPIFMSITSHWAPKSEAGVAIGIISSSQALAYCLDFFVSGLECEGLGWPSVFSSTAALSALFSLVWLWLFRNGPSSSASTSQAERDYILLYRTHSARSSSTATRKTPWAAMARSAPVWATLLSTLASAALISIVNVYAPTFMLEVLHSSIERNGFLTAVPVLAFGAGRLFSGCCLVGQLKKRGLSETAEIRVFNAVCLLGPGIASLCLGLLSPSWPSWSVVVLMAISQATAAFSVGGYQKSILLVAHQHSGTLSSLCQASNAAITVALPYVVAAATPNGTAEEWRLVWWSLAGLGLIATIFFLIFGSGEEAAWANGSRGWDSKPSQAHLLSLNSASKDSLPTICRAA